MTDRITIDMPSEDALRACEHNARRHMDGAMYACKSVAGEYTGDNRWPKELDDAAVEAIGHLELAREYAAKAKKILEDGNE